MAERNASELYSKALVGMLEVVWVEGWLSPGGPEEVARAVDSVDFAGKTVLDIGCGVGGIDFLLVEQYGAAHVTGIDVEDTVLVIARSRAERRGLSGRTAFVKVAPGPLPFADRSFDIVFSKDAIVHIPDKHVLMRDIHRLLRPGGWFVASDWLISHDGEPSTEMKDYIAAEGLDFGMASPQRYRDALGGAGFTDISLVSRNRWYREAARREYESMKGPLYDRAVTELGRDYVDHNIAIWAKMLVVLDKGEHCPTHLRGRKAGG
ncbi:MAG TPA: methyltransferase domain-containing protein [Aestuariivirgaceae bacterium]|nr:methyltransferase domain-containing protein [Aestuariivirgaceae bacterium]